MAPILAFARDVAIQGAVIVAAGYLTFKKIVNTVNRFFNPEENPEESAAHDIIYLVMIMFASVFLILSIDMFLYKFTVIDQYITDALTLLVTMLLTPNIIIGLAFHILEWRGGLNADIVDKATLRGYFYYSWMAPLVWVDLALEIAGCIMSSLWLMSIVNFTCLGGWAVATTALIIEVMEVVDKAD